MTRLDRPPRNWRRPTLIDGPEGALMKRLSAQQAIGLDEIVSAGGTANLHSRRHGRSRVTWWATPRGQRLELSTRTVLALIQRGALKSGQRHPTTRNIITVRVAPEWMAER